MGDVLAGVPLLAVWEVGAVGPLIYEHIRNDQDTTAHKNASSGTLNMSGLDEKLSMVLRFGVSYDVFSMDAFVLRAQSHGTESR